MFGIGTSEILIILLIALLVLGPNEIPKLAKTLGRGMRELERAKNELKDSIQFEIDEKEASAAKAPEKTENEESAEDKEEEESSAIKNPTSNSPV
ncbi:MAG: twin-arginine translocase TatA/TatE family subunit [Candidatus Dadabacteria bacterium]|nr:twin-arginine translocase TatA/TatE family subunit [Candidatus Dadabacteria bacterium]